jgi:SAM-dependent methyltransferase
MSIQTSEEAIQERYRAAAASAAAGDGPVSLGAGDLLRFAGIQPDETVLDLGCGTGADAIGAAHAAGPTGRVIGIDMLPEMCDEARRNTQDLGTVSIRQADMAALPLPDACVDVVISNCVINLARDKARVIREAHRVLAPGGRMVIVDTAFAAEPDADVRTDMKAWSCCVSGALTVETYRQVVEGAGFVDPTVTDLGAFDASRVSDAEVRSVLVTARRAGGDGHPAIRPAVPDDLEAILGLLDAEGLPREGFDVHAAVVLVDADSRTVDGVVMLEQFDRGATFLRSLAVEPGSRRQGLGEQLVKAAVQMGAAIGAQDTYLLTADAGEFFARHGFATEETSLAQAACPSPEFDEACCSGATAMRLHHAPAATEATEDASCCSPVIGSTSIQLSTPPTTH